MNEKAIITLYHNATCTSTTHNKQKFWGTSIFFGGGPVFPAPGIDAPDPTDLLYNKKSTRGLYCTVNKYNYTIRSTDRPVGQTSRTDRSVRRSYRVNAQYGVFTAYIISLIAVSYRRCGRNLRAKLDTVINSTHYLLTTPI